MIRQGHVKAWNLINKHSQQSALHSLAGREWELQRTLSTMSNAREPARITCSPSHNAAHNVGVGGIGSLPA